MTDALIYYELCCYGHLNHDMRQLSGKIRGQSNVVLSVSLFDKTKVTKSFLLLPTAKSAFRSMAVAGEGNKDLSTIYFETAFITNTVIYHSSQPRI